MRYAMAGTWWPERLTISDDAGTARFEVRNCPGFSIMLSLTAASGDEEIAQIKRRRGGSFQVLVRGEEAGLVRCQKADRYDVQSALGPLAAEGSVAAGRYSLTRDGLVMATVSRQIANDVRQTQEISADIGSGDAVALLATVLAIEAVRYERDGRVFNPRALLDLPGAVLLELLNPFNYGQ